MRKSDWKNPILEAQAYLEYLNSSPNFSYKNVADKFGVSRARVSQMMALIKKLPDEIIDYFHMENNSEELKYFTERLIILDYLEDISKREGLGL